MTATVAIDLPVPMVGGPCGLDSPAVTEGIPRFRWYAWLDLADDRAAGRRSPLSTIEWALGHAVDWKEWPLWWLRGTAEGWQVHAAQVTSVEGGGQTLLAGCMASQPWKGAALQYDVVLRTTADPAGNWDRCGICEPVAYRMYGDGHDHHRDRPVRTP